MWNSLAGEENSHTGVFTPGCTSNRPREFDETVILDFHIFIRTLVAVSLVTQAPRWRFDTPSAFPTSITARRP